MKVGIIKRISRDDLSRAAGGDLPKWVDVMLDPLNEFIEKVGRLAQKNINISDNFASTLVTQKFDSGVEKEINPQSPTRVFAILPHDAVGKLITGFGFTRKQNGAIGVVITFTNLDGTPATESADVVLSVLF